MAEVSSKGAFFGENIDKSLFEDGMIKTVRQMRIEGKSVYDLEATKSAMSAEKDKYVFITLYKGHASIVVVDKDVYDTLLFSPVFSQMADGPSLSYKVKDTSRLEQMPLRQYHVALDRTGKRYILSRNMYYMPWLMKSRSFFVGETAMDYLYLEMLCLTEVPDKYRLVVDDCLEFAKRFATEIALRENGVRKTELMALFQTLVVSEDYSSAKLEQSSRNNPESAMSTALLYFSSFRIERLIFTVLAIVLAFAAFRYVTS